MSAFGGVVTCVSIIDSLRDQLVIGGLIWNLHMVDHVIERWKQNKSPIQAILTLHYSYIVSLTLFCGSRTNSHIAHNKMFKQMAARTKNVSQNISSIDCVWLSEASFGKVGSGFQLDIHDSKVQKQSIDVMWFISIR